MIELSGIPVKEKVLKQVELDMADIKNRGEEVCLATVLVGGDYGSSVYVNMKIATCEKYGIKSEHFYFDEDVTEEELLSLIDTLNKRKDITAILVQLPLPKHIDEYKIACAIAPEKDADCFNPTNVGKLYLEKNPKILPCTPSGVIDILKTITNIESKNVAILGRSNIVGKPLAELLIKENATVTVLHTKSEETYKNQVLKNADIVVAAIGKANYVTKEMIGENQILIDVGINRLNGVQVGDFDYENVKEVAYACTPPKGGTGACTIANLMRNVLVCHSLQK